MCNHSPIIDCPALRESARRSPAPTRKHVRNKLTTTRGDNLISPMSIIDCLMVMPNGCRGAFYKSLRSLNCAQLAGLAQDLLFLRQLPRLTGPSKYSCNSHLRADNGDSSAALCPREPSRALPLTAARTNRAVAA